MIDFLKSLAKPKLKSINEVVINEKALLDNLDYLQSLKPLSEIMPVLKSNAYWHWLKEITKIVAKSLVNYVCVDSVIEYQYALKYTKKSIILLSETLKENYEFFDFKRTSFVVYNIDTLKYLKSLDKNIKIHLFLNTWMNREWILKEELFNFLHIIKESKLNLEWVCSHFSSADELTSIQSEIQSENFKKMMNEIESKGFNPKLKHISASSWTLKYADPYYNAFRPWISIYWINPLMSNDKDVKAWEPLKPVMQIYSTLMSIKDIKEGEKVGYSESEELTQDSKIWIVPFWYYEWLNRKLSGKYHVKINWKYAKILGKISMNITTIDLTWIECKVGDRVEIISDDKSNLNSIYNMAKLTNLISYELLTWVNEKIKRIVK